jgi:release factor glutamine methyltransferase
VSSPSASPSAPSEAWTLGRLLSWTTRFFTEKAAETPRLDAEVLLAHVLGCKRIDLYVRFEEPASDQARDRYRNLVRQRAEGCPVAYLVGKKEFFSLEFAVTPAVLVPRPETEILVTECLERARGFDRPRILDVGTGSGAVAIALASQLPAAAVTAVDISADALAVARSNAAKHGLADRIRLVQSDLLAALPRDEQFDFILSNPPYVAEAEWSKLHPGVRDYEPRVALIGGAGGYEIIERLIDQARPHLRLAGCMLIEIGAAQEEPVRQIAARLGCCVHPTLRDHANRPRVIHLTLPEG